MNKSKFKGEKIISEIIEYNKEVPFFRFISACEHTLITNDEITPLSSNISGEFGPVPGFGAIYRLVGDGTHSPTFSGINKRSSSEDYDPTLGVVNSITFFFDGSDYWYSIAKIGNRESYSHGIFIDGFPEDEPHGPGLTMAYFGDGVWWPFGATSFIGSMDWETFELVDLQIYGKDIEIYADDLYLDASNVIVGNRFTVDGNTSELVHIETKGIACDDGLISINSNEGGGKFVIIGDNRTGFKHESANSMNSSSFQSGVNVGGGLVTVTLADGGTGHVVGESLLILITGTGAAGGTIYVTEIDDDGAVVAFEINDIGTAYTVNNNLEAYSYGSGTGCKVNITEVTEGGYVFLKTDKIGDSVIQPIQLLFGSTKEYEFADNKLDLGTNGLKTTGLAEHANNAAALLAGLSEGDFYRTGDDVKVVHS